LVVNLNSKNLELSAHLGMNTKAYIGRLLLEDTVQAVKMSVKFSDFESFRQELEMSIHFNSSCVRKKRTSNIVKWFFPTHSLDNLLSKLWAFYKDENILHEALKYQFLVSQPLVAKFVVNYILPLTPGHKIDIDRFRQFLLDEYGALEPYLLNNLSLNCKDLGFLVGAKNRLIVCQLPPPRTSLLILIHYLFAKDIRTIAIKDIIQNPFWQYLGIRDTENLRRIISEADAESIISKYVVADELEQITTRYSFNEFIQKKIQF
jgi:hypothetical protein